MLKPLFYVTFFSTFCFGVCGFSEPVPFLMGKTLAEINDEFPNPKFNLLSYHESSTKPKDRVFDQIPEPGAEMREGGKIVVRFSDGIMIPKGILGRSVEGVASDLTALGISVERTDTQVLGVTKGTVTVVVPPEGTFIDSTQDVVFLQVSSTGSVAVPKLVGLESGRAVAALAALGLTGKLVAKFEIGESAGCGRVRNYGAEVTKSDPPEGASIPLGTEVTMEGKQVILGIYNLDRCPTPGRQPD